MHAYLLRRLLLIIPTLLIITVIVFAGLRFVPGDAVDIMVTLTPYKSGDEDPRVVLRRELGLDLPIHVQYGRWMGGVVRGDLGTSFWSKLPVTQQIVIGLPVSLEVGSLALVFSLLIALPVAIYSGIRPDSVTDHVLRAVAIAFICVPSFWIGTMVLIYPPIWWGWAPRLSWIPFAANPVAHTIMVVIPAFILGMWLSGITMRLTRNMMLEVLRQDYIRTAWAKGLRERLVIVRHALKNALIPVLTMVGLQLPVLVGGAVVVESIFNLPGVGGIMVQAMEKRDYAIVSGLNLIAATFVLFVNLIIDLSYAWLDPRIRYQ